MIDKLNEYEAFETNKSKEDLTPINESMGNRLSGLFNDISEIIDVLPGISDIKENDANILGDELQKLKKLFAKKLKNKGLSGW